MSALARIDWTADRPEPGFLAAEAAVPDAAPAYFAVIYTDPWHGVPSGKYATALRMLAALAEENPGYLGYEVEEMEGGREYAVTYWATPAHIRQWKKSSAIVIGDNGVLDRIYGREGCRWPWLERVSEGQSGTAMTVY
jgi:hypothetical protein